MAPADLDLCMPIIRDHVQMFSDSFFLLVPLAASRDAKVMILASIARVVASACCLALGVGPKAADAKVMMLL